MYSASQYGKKGLCELPLHSFCRRLRNQEAEICPVQPLLLVYINSHFQGYLREEEENCASKKIALCNLEGERKNLDNLDAH